MEIKDFFYTEGEPFKCDNDRELYINLGWLLGLKDAVNYLFDIDMSIAYCGSEFSFRLPIYYGETEAKVYQSEWFSRKKVRDFYLNEGGDSAPILTKLFIEYIMKREIWEQKELEILYKNK